MTGHYIQQALDQSRIPVSELADELGVTVQSVYRWLRGEVEPKLSVLRAVARVTGKPLVFFLGPDAAPSTVTVGNGRPLATLVVHHGDEEVCRVRIDGDTELSMRLE